MDSAHIKLSKTPPEALLPNEQEAIIFETLYNMKDNELALSIQELTVRIADISLQLVDIQQGDNRSKDQLIGERAQARVDLSTAQGIQRGLIPRIAVLNRQLRQLQARVALLTGFRPLVINPDCLLIAQTS